MAAVMSWWAQFLAMFRRPVEPPRVWERFEGTDVWHREMSAQELEADTRERLRRHRAQRTPPSWLRPRR